MLIFCSLPHRVLALAGVLLIAACASPRQTDAPAPATGLAQRALTNPEFTWDSISSPTHTTYAAAHSSHSVDSLHARVESAIQHALRTLHEPTYPGHLRTFHVRSRDEMAQIAGVRSTGTTEPRSQTVLLMANETWAPFTRHEVMHAVSLLLWSEPGNTIGRVEEGSPLWLRGGWLREGVAAHAEDRCGGYSNRAISAAYAVNGELIPGAQLIEEFYSLPDLASYLQAGSLVEFILSRYGIDQLRTLWNTLSLENSLGLGASELHDAWANWLESIPRQDLPDLEALRTGGCG